MPFYLRKGVSVGPFRFNISKSGIGISTGVKGLRIGSGPRGNYIHVGHSGLYYRSSFGGHPKRQGSQLKPSSPAATDGDFERVEADDAPELINSSAEHVLEQINEKLQLIEIWKVVLWVGILAAFFAPFLSLPIKPEIAEGIIVVCTCGALAIAAYFDHIRRSVVILYNLEPNEREAFKNFIEEFDKLSSSAHKWNVEEQAANSDWKRSGGATRSVKQKVAYFGLRAPPVVQTNISIPAVIGGKWNVYFFPDIVLVTNGREAGAVEYKDLSIEFRETQFVVSGRVPSDARIVDYTWLYVNRDGSPDRRFNGNRQLPVALYQEVRFVSNGGLNKLLLLSKLQSEDQFIHSISTLGEIVRRKPTETTPTSPLENAVQLSEPLASEETADRSRPHEDQEKISRKSIFFIACFCVVALVVIPTSWTGEKSSVSEGANHNQDSKASVGMDSPPSKPKIRHSDSVLAIQKRLSALGYDPGPIDGIVGSRTTTAIRHFQTKHGLIPTGTVDDAFLDKLYERNE